MTTTLASYTAGQLQTQADALSGPEKVGAFVSGAITSGWQSIANTGVDVVNFLGGDAERFDTAKSVEGIGQAFNSAGWGDYYKENQTAIDLTGFIGTSIIPGGIAIKGLKALQRGEAAGSFGNALRYSSTKQLEYLKAANADLASQSGSLFSRVNGNLLASYGFGAADNFLQVAVAEAAIAATMKASPMLDNQSWGDLLVDGTKNALVFGAGFGGLVNVVSTIGVYKSAAKLVDQTTNKYSTMALGEKINLSTGDKVLKAFDELSQLPKEVLESDKLLNFSFTLAGEKVSQTLNVGNRAETALARAADKAKTNMERLMTEGFSPSDPTIGSALAEFMAKNVKAARTAPEHDIGNSAAMTLANRFTGMVEAKGLSDLELSVSSFPKGLELGNFVPQLFLNVRTGATSTSAIPTIADVASGIQKLEIKGDKVLSGAHTFKFGPENFNPELGLGAMDSLEITARHVWASTLKKVEGVIDQRDFSLLDKISLSPEVTIGAKVEIKIPGFGNVPLDDFAQSSWKDQVLSQKITALQETLDATGGKADLGVLARKLNVEDKWIADTIEKNFARVEEGSIRELSEYGKRETLKVTYDKNVPRAWDTPGEGAILFNEKLVLAQEARERGAKVVLGDYFEQLPSLKADVVKKEANRTGSGAGLFTASDADYTEALARTMQSTGVVTSKAIAEFSKKALDSISTAAHQVNVKPQARAELASILELGRRTAGNDGWVMKQVTGASDSGYVLVKEKVAQLGAEDLAAHLSSASTDNVIKLVHPETAKFLEQWQAWNKGAHDRHSVAWNAVGQVSNRNADALYFPPVDTRKLNHFAFLVPHEGVVAGKTEVGMLVAKDAAQLETMAANVGSDFKVVFKRDSEDFFKAKGQYEFDRALNRTSVDGARAKVGTLSSMAPNMTDGAAITDFLAYMERKESSIVRDGVELKYAQEFAQLRTLSEEATQSQTSRMTFLNKAFQKSRVKDPYGDYIKTALDINKQSEFPLLSQLNEFVDSAGTRAYAALGGIVQKASKGEVSWDEASAAMARTGLGGAVKEELFRESQTLADKNLIRGFVRKSNAILATTQLGLDAANALVNIISSPIRMAAEMQAVKKLVPELYGELTGVAGPSGELEFSAAKVMAQAVRNYWGPEAAAKLERFKKIGAVSDDLMMHRNLVSDIASAATLETSKISALGEKIAEVGGKITGNAFAEKFTRFVAADAMDQFTSKAVALGRMSQAEADSFINIFVNRVQGNYHASQRPVAFQGTVGSAISLFQTYQFGMLQQLGRFIQNGDKRAMMTAAGLQTSIFGMQGLPFFDAVNSQLLGKYSDNPGHKDLYSQIGGSPIGDWMLYGSASALPLFGDKGPALYSRGDLNPRHIMILPTSPMETPVVQTYTKMLGTLVKMGELLGAGAPAKEAVLFGIEHNGFSRPLAGLAQAFSGYSTTGKGNLTATNDLLSIASAWRIAGARPIDEAVAIQQKFRQDQYQAYDAQKLEVLGEAVKMSIRGGRVPSDEEYSGFMSKYVERGGRIENYTKALNRWTKDADVSVVNKLMDKHNSPQAQRMIEIMGGTPLQDFSNTPPPTAPVTE